MDDLVELTPGEAGVAYIDVSRLFVDITIIGGASEDQTGELRARILDSLNRAERHDGPSVIIHDEKVRIAFYQAR